jgi:hypothetical protein
LRLPPFAALAVLSGPGAGELAGALEKLGSVSGAGNSKQSVEPIELSQLGDDRWVVRASDRSSLADALAVVGRPAERVRVDVGPVRF